MKRILITGANGFIGSTLTDHALANDWEVTAAVRTASNRSFLQDPRIRFIELHFDQEPELRRAIENAGRFDFVAHIAGATKALHREDFFHTNAEYTRRLVEILNQDGIRPEKFLFLSSLAAMGPANSDSRIRPQDPPKPVSAYGASKRAAEQYLESLAGFPWVVVQPTAVFGPRDKDFLELIRLIGSGFEFYIGMKPQQASFIYIKDLANLMVSALLYGRAGRKYIASDNRDYTADDLGQGIREVLQRRTLRLRIPLPVVQVIAAVAETLGRWRGTIPALNREKLNEIGGANWWCDATQTFEELHFAPQYDLQTGIRETVNWYKAQGWL